MTDLQAGNGDVESEQMSHQGQIGVYFDSGGYRLLGTLFLARGDAPKPTAVILHGIPGIEKNYDLAHALREDGWNSLIFHYRGCWGSGGCYVLRTIPDDVHAALDDLSSGRYPWVDPARLVLIGHSLGGWAAVLAGADDPRARAVAVCGAISDPRSLPFTAEVAAAEFTPWLHGFTPEDFQSQWEALDTAYRPVEQVARLAPRPLLILHGKADEGIPVEQAEALFARAGEPRELLIHPAANHSFTWHRPWLRDHLLDWLRQLDLAAARGAA
jgi:dipeptidyl aminopeptidase/acylaminoacyl peptidase